MDRQTIDTQIQACYESTTDSNSLRKGSQGQINKLVNCHLRKVKTFLCRWVVILSLIII